MKNLLALIFIGSMLFVACSEDDGGDDNGTPQEYDYSEVINDYVDNTIIATYADMKDNAILLLEATESFAESSSQSDVDQACAYWKSTRKPWESSEAFLFGPAAFKNLDPLLDSWPLDQAQLDQVLAGNQTLTADYVRDALGAVLRGFHTVEYLLFRDGAPRQATDFTQRETEYLIAVAEVLRDDCIILWASWAGVEDGTEEAEILEALEVEIDNPYAENLKNAGQAGSEYLSQTDAVDEILQGMIGIADEVANAKIADPYSSKDVLEVESWFSWNSLTDFQNNIRSIENSYINGYNGSTPGASLSDLVAEKDADLDAEVKTAIDNAIGAIADIPEPFRNNLSNSEKIDAAISAINGLLDIIESDVRPLFVN